MPGRGMRIGMPAAASLLVNAGMIVAIATLGIGGKVKPAPAPSEAMTVLTLAAPPGPPEAAVPTEAAAPPPAIPRTPVATRADPPRTIIPVPVPVALPTPAVPVAMPPVAVAAAGPAGPAHVSPPVRSAPAQSAPAPAGHRDGVAGAERGASLAYAARVRSWLLAHRVYPRRARMRRDEGVVLVRFVLDRAGALIEGEILHGSGHASLDEEAVAMLSRASPYPAMPVALAGNRVELTAPIAFELPG